MGEVEGRREGRVRRGVLQRQLDGVHEIVETLTIAEYLREVELHHADAAVCAPDGQSGVWCIGADGE